MVTFSLFHFRRSVLIAVISLIFATFFITSPAHAATKIARNQIERAATFESVYSDKPRGASTQGGVITKNYYVFSDCKGIGSASCRNGYIRIVSRNSCAKIKNIKTNVSSIRGLYYDRGKNLVTIVSKNGSKVGCISLGSNPSFKTSGSCAMPPGVYFAAGGTSQGVAAEYNGYKYKVAGYGTSVTYILVSGKGTSKQYYIANKDIRAVSKLKAQYGFEPEGISVDSKTGEVYISYALRISGSRRIFFLKIKSSVFKSFTGKSGQSSTPFCNNTTASTKSTTNSSSSSSTSTEPTTSTTKPTFEPIESTYDGSIATTFFGNIQDDGEGCGIYTILNLILDILAIGIGIAATIGITISGITYLTAKGNEEQTRKAKRRIYEIIIGLAAYAVLWAALNWLLPGGDFNTSNVCKEISAIHDDTADHPQFATLDKPVPPPLP